MDVDLNKFSMSTTIVQESDSELQMTDCEMTNGWLNGWVPWWMSWLNCRVRQNMLWMRRATRIQLSCVNVMDEWIDLCFSLSTTEILISFNYSAQVNNATARVQTKKAPVVPNGTYFVVHGSHGAMISRTDWIFKTVFMLHTIEILSCT